MTYRVLYGDVAAMTGHDRHFDDGRLDERLQSERFSTEYEALRRARELLDDDISAVVAVADTQGNLLSGLRLQLRLGYACD